jgi:hypothetical protein
VSGLPCLWKPLDFDPFGRVQLLDPLGDLHVKLRIEQGWTSVIHRGSLSDITDMVWLLSHGRLPATPGSRTPQVVGGTNREQAVLEPSGEEFRITNQFQCQIISDSQA